MKTILDASPVAKKFVLEWGELGTKWGINRTMAQIHALLWVSDRPLTAGEIAETLSVAQSNVSTNLRELQGWRIIKTVPVMGDRREHYESLKDVWETFQIVLEERKRREADPALAMLRECVAELGDSPAHAHAAERLRAMKDFFEETSSWYEEIKPMPVSVLRRIMKLGGKVQKLLGFSSN